MAQGQDEPIEIVGLMKWFDPVRGFGFLVDSAGGPDVLVHGNVLRNFGQSTVAEGAEVRVQAIPTARGKQAVAVLSVTPPPAVNGAPIADLCGQQPEDVAGLPFHPARVKWFDKAKGFGFANVFGQPADVFLHIEVLRHSGFADLTVGEAIALKVVDGRRGPMAALLASWDRAALPAGQPPGHPRDGGGEDPAGYPDIAQPDEAHQSEAPHNWPLESGTHPGEAHPGGLLEDGTLQLVDRPDDERRDRKGPDRPFRDIPQAGTPHHHPQPQLHVAAQG